MPQKETVNYAIMLGLIGQFPTHTDFKNLTKTKTKQREWPTPTSIGLGIIVCEQFLNARRDFSYFMAKEPDKNVNNT